MHCTILQTLLIAITISSWYAVSLTEDAEATVKTCETDKYKCHTLVAINGVGKGKHTNSQHK